MRLFQLQVLYKQVVTERHVIPVVWSWKFVLTNFIGQLYTHFPYTIATIEALLATM